MLQISRQLLHARLVDRLNAETLPQESPVSSTALEEIASDEEFVTQAFLRILGRNPELEAREHFLRVLRSEPRSFVVDWLQAARAAESENSRASAAPPTRDGTSPSPDGGAVFAAGVSGRPTPPETSRVLTIDLTGLSGLDDPDEFVQEMYRRVLGRPADFVGFLNYRDMLMCGIPRIEILACVAASPEAAARQVAFTWRGGPLRPPVGVSFTVRFRVLLRKWFRSGRVEDLERGLWRIAGQQQHRLPNPVVVAGLAKTAAHLARLEESVVDTTRQVVITRQAIASVEKQCDILRKSLKSQTALIECQADGLNSVIGAVREVQLSVPAAAQVASERAEQLQQIFSSVARDFQTGQEATMRLIDAHRADAAASTQRLLAGADSVAGAIREIQQSLPAAVQLASERAEQLQQIFSSVARDFQTRQEGTMRVIDACRAEAAASSQQLLAGTDSVAGAIREIQQCLPAAAQLASERAEQLQQIFSSVAHDFQTRQEGTMRLIDAFRAETVGSSQQLLARCGGLAPPVLTGPDVLAARVDGFLLGVAREDWILADYYFHGGPVEPGLSRFFQSTLRPGMVFVDVGANVGLYTLRAARAVGTEGAVHSFEPDPRTFQILQQNVRANALEHVKVYEMALLDRNCETALYRSEGISTWNSLYTDSRGGGSVLVKGTTLDEALQHVERIDVVKIDAEGAEPAILEGMERILGRNPGLKLVIEFAPSHLRRAGASPSEFLDSLYTKGFCIEEVDDLTGELKTVNPEQLASEYSVNLCLRKRETPGS